MAETTQFDKTTQLAATTQLAETTQLFETTQLAVATQLAETTQLAKTFELAEGEAFSGILTVDLDPVNRFFFDTRSFLWILEYRRTPLKNL